MFLEHSSNSDINNGNHEYNHNTDYEANIIALEKVCHSAHLNTSYCDEG